MFWSEYTPARFAKYRSALARIGPLRFAKVSLAKDSRGSRAHSLVRG